MRVALLFFFLLHSKWWRKQKLTRMHSWIRINRLFHFMQLKTSLEFFSLQKLAIKLIRNIWVSTKYTSLLLISCDVVVLTSKKKKTNITTEIKKNGTKSIALFRLSNESSYLHWNVIITPPHGTLEYTYPYIFGHASF